ncbi:MAG: hypothetical protein OXH45_07560 [Gammaproteobacteria bacterium]|nr:hypothetical protein [Gammaproteobacteria bacterium]
MPQTAFDTHAEAGKLKRAGWPEEQAEAMVDLVARAPLNPQLAQDMDWLKTHVQSIVTRLQGVETRLQGVESRLKGVETRVERTENHVQRIETRVLRNEDAMSGMATKVDLEVLRGETMTSIEALRGETIGRIEGLRSEMLRAFWIQGLALASLIIGLAGTMLAVNG